MKTILAENIHIELINETHAKAIFEMVDRNRIYLRAWLPFVDKMQSIEFAESFVKGTIQSNEARVEHAFVIFENNQAYRLNSQMDNWRNFYQRILEMAYSYQNTKIEQR